MSTDTKALRPCPFCGGGAVLDGKSESVAARCETCCVVGPMSYFDPDDDDAIESAEASAISAWNRRAKSERAASAALEQIIDRFIEEYEFDSGEGGSHSPGEFERVVMKDAFMGLLVDSEWLAQHRSTPAEQPAPAAWADLVEERMRQWRQRLMNRSGDRLALDDFMSAETIDDLIDFVCAPIPAPAESEAVRLPPLPEPHVNNVPQLEDENWRAYTAEQMQAYAEAAVGNCRAAQDDAYVEGRKDERAALAQHPPVDQAALRGNAGAPTEAMVTAYLKANDAYWKDVDAGPSRLGIWRDGTPREATHVSLIAALAALADTQPSSHGSEEGQYATVWHEGSRSFYRAKLLRKMGHAEYIEEGDAAFAQEQEGKE